MRFFLGSGLSPSKTSASCKMQNAKGGDNTRRGEEVNTTCSKLPRHYAIYAWEKRPVTKCRQCGKNAAWQWLPLRVTEGEGRGADRPLRLLAACRHPKPFTIDSRLWPLKVTSVKRAFFSSYLSLFFRVGGVVQADTLSLSLSLPTRKAAPMNYSAANMSMYSKWKLH